MSTCLDQPTTQMADLPYLVRRVLRYVARYEIISRCELEILADLDAGIHSETALLLMRGLITRSEGGNTFSITDAGAECVSSDPSPLRESRRSQQAGIDRENVHIKAPS